MGLTGGRVETSGASRVCGWEQVEPQLYMMKWIRLLLGREFHLEDVLLLWDAIFADQVSLGIQPDVG